MALEITGIPVNGMAAVPAMRGRPQIQASRSSSEQPERKRPHAVPVHQTIREIEEFSTFLNRRLKYSVNPDTDQVIVKVIDRETDKVIKVLPPEALQKLHSRMKETIGLLFDETI
ncbi:MAG: flagellar protein FlaG [Spirochaetales bacterium]|jgi:flagellar protein FlaG|nr:flagellar protein FlaG [Spirochaetales bacterium]